MNRVAIVVQLCHESIVGGSEALAWQYATLLSDEFKVDIITTTALDYTTWANVLTPGCETKQSINIYRFPVTIGRSEYWHNLHARLLQEFNYPKYIDTENCKRISWSIALQEEFIRYQGPYSEPLLSFLRAHCNEYQCIIFATYLYPTSYFGIAEIPLSKVLLAPTLHDEPPAYLSAYKYMYKRVSSFIWLTNAEKALGEKLWGEVPGKLVSMGVDTLLRSPFQAEYPYLLYCGRIDQNKGCNDLVNFFIEFKKSYPSSLRLILTGKSELDIPTHPDIDFRGFVTPEEKFQLMAGASIFVMSSPYESFSIVTLEAMAQCTPVLVNGACQVLVEHVTRSGGGKIYQDCESFFQAVREMLSNQDKLTEMGDIARKYVVANFAFSSVKNNLLEMIEKYTVI
ncbi:MAG: glycosyltransferase family 4 protein [Pelatocladus maniniholoensis HA4357-MV3]|jgi:glycosyltransferase involved in cell wall biosynthesis|uniref:Glycosyltransferase family 4 protein n=1 Tax=Pelatocladus maniniholoensis HA4357-MV3 TaxID=1117104 RepID=A0A9E3HBY1_9NOST|nr:glycosyltransferase family 4 protein [Pelatocladus maniniholoensis HA4357-MV3]BAZ67917.1 group 1 glycosyl transferase [Fischerella sp. NIES-4106]